MYALGSAHESFGLKERPTTKQNKQIDKEGETSLKNHLYYAHCFHVLAISTFSAD